MDYPSKVRSPLANLMCVRSFSLKVTGHTMQPIPYWATPTVRCSKCQGSSTFHSLVQDLFWRPKGADPIPLPHDNHLKTVLKSLPGILGQVSLVPLSSGSLITPNFPQVMWFSLTLLNYTPRNWSNTYGVNWVIQNRMNKSPPSS